MRNWKEIQFDLLTEERIERRQKELEEGLLDFAMDTNIRAVEGATKKLMQFIQKHSKKWDLVDSYNYEQIKKIVYSIQTNIKNIGASFEKKIIGALSFDDLYELRKVRKVFTIQYKNLESSLNAMILPMKQKKFKEMVEATKAIYPALKETLKALDEFVSRMDDEAKKKILTTLSEVDLWTENASRLIDSLRKEIEFQTEHPGEVSRRFKMF